MKKSLVGKTVRVRVTKGYYDSYDGQKGKVICKVHDEKNQFYIVQFCSRWGYFKHHKLAVIK